MVFLVFNFTSCYTCIIYISWFDDTNENHENWYSTDKNDFTTIK